MRLPKTSTRKAYIAISVLGAAFALPVAAGLASVLRPSPSAAKPEWIAVTTLDSLPADSIPRKFPISVPQYDAWTRLPDEVCAYVYLLRTASASQVRALRATNHAGCIVEFNAERREFQDSCWNGRWDIEGRAHHSIPEWGDLQPVRTAVRADVAFVNLWDALR